MHFQSQKTFTTVCVIMSAKYLCCRYIDLLHCAGEGPGQPQTRMFSSKVMEGLAGSRVILDMAFHGIHVCSADLC